MHSLEYLQPFHSYIHSVCPIYFYIITYMYAGSCVIGHLFFIGEKNVIFRKDITELVTQPYESASKEIHTISQQLIKSQLLVQVFEAQFIL